MITTTYRKYEFNDVAQYEAALTLLPNSPDNLVELGINSANNKFCVDVMWTNEDWLIWQPYQIYPGIDTLHTFLGANDYQYNNDINAELALCEAYPHFINKDVTLLQMDNLYKLVRNEPISDKGMQPLKEYYYNDKLVWSIESIYWFDTDNELHNVGGVVKKHIWYDRVGQPLITTLRYIPFSNEKKSLEMKSFRECAINYLRSKEPALFTLLYNFFGSDIQRYIDTGNKEEFQDILTTAQTSHPYIGDMMLPDGTVLTNVPVVQLVLSQPVELPNGGFITVLQGILYEL